MNSRSSECLSNARIAMQALRTAARYYAAIEEAGPLYISAAERFRAEMALHSAAVAYCRALWGKSV